MDTTIETRVAEMSDSEVQANLAPLVAKGYTKRFVNNWSHRLMDFCHDRVRCKTIGAEYGRMNYDDVSRVKLYTYYWLRN